ncbi:hypothetical protein GUJ93_ZPchr0007g5933 [Zizania palustris]|uniref:SWIM-type domain-containing protein n=1 Tax=Zizania palustris TaxID=103762 RepID=A0A8J5T5E9_ZIZPA|nr:hypothetical protein GUJ93_ZPchr0007g5933 [Zizania palustris]
MSVTEGVALAVADAVWSEIRSAGHASDEHLSILETLFGKNMLRACKILDEGGVRRVTGAPSGRSVFLVVGESKRKEEYICFPEHLCTCYSFFYDIVGRGQQLCCKHQLAARLAEAVSKHQEIEIAILSARQPATHLAFMESCYDNSSSFTMPLQYSGVWINPHMLKKGSGWREANHELLKDV